MAVINPKWRTVQLPRGVIEQVEKYIQTEDARRKGIYSISSYITQVLNKELGS